MKSFQWWPVAQSLTSCFATVFGLLAPPGILMIHDRRKRGRVSIDRNPPQKVDVKLDHLRSTRHIFHSYISTSSEVRCSISLYLHAGKRLHDSRFPAASGRGVTCTQPFLIHAIPASCIKKALHIPSWNTNTVHVFNFSHILSNFAASCSVVVVVVVVLVVVVWKFAWNIKLPKYKFITF